MSNRPYIGSFQVTTVAAGNVIQVRGVGFQGQAVFFWWNGLDSAVNASGEESYRGGWGFAKSTTERRTVAWTSLYANVNGEGDTLGSAAACIATILPTATDPSTLEGLADFDAWNADGFDIKIDDQFATAFRVFCMVFPAVGSELTDVAIGTCNGKTTTGTQDITTPGFQPDLLICISRNSSAEDTVTNSMYPTIGIAVGPGSTQQMVWAGTVEDNVGTTSTFSYCRRGDLIAEGVGSLGMAQLNAWLPTGFQLNWSSANAAGFGIYYLALKGGRYGLGGVVTGTNTNDIVTLTGIDFQPMAALYLSANRAEDASATWLATLALSMGAATAAAQSAIEVQDKNAFATGDTFKAIYVDQVYVNADLSATMVIEGLMSWTAWTADGATHTMTDGDPVASFVGILCIGESGSSEPDAQGLLHLGARILYTDAGGITAEGMMVSAQAGYGDAADLAVLRVSGAAVVAVQLTSVTHKSTSSVPPYWVGYEGERTQPLIMQTTSG